MARPARAQAPPLLPLLLPLLLLAVGAGCSAPPRGARQLCHFELPTDAQCSIEATANGSCKIHMLPQGNCFEEWRVRDNTSFMESINYTHHFDKETYTTSVEIYKYNGRRLLIITLRPQETWWQVDVPSGEHDIIITELPGSLNETNPITNTIYYEGCPPPRISYIALRKLHKFEIFISPLDEHVGLFDDGFVSVGMVTSNKTNFSLTDCNDSFINQIKLQNGTIGGSISIEDVYSTEFCFMIWVNSSNGRFLRYECDARENMTEPPFRAFETSIRLPVLWVMGLVLLIIFLILASLVPLAIHKGVVRMQCGSSARRRDGNGLEGERRRPHADAVRPLLDAALAAAGTAGASTCGKEYQQKTA